MEKIIREFKEEFEKAKQMMMKMMCEEGMLEGMNEDAFHAMQTMLKLMNVSLELTVKQAETINEINEKLDRMKA